MPSGPIICQASRATGQQGAPIADGHGTARGGAAAGARAGEGGAAVCAAPKQLSTFPTVEFQSRSDWSFGDRDWYSRCLIFSDHLQACLSDSVIKIFG